MFRIVRYLVASLICGAIWALGVWRFAAGDNVAGTALIFLGGICIAALIGLYRRDPGESLVNAIEAFLTGLSERG